MELHDHRTKEQKRTHTVIVMMTDRFLSGWGGAQGGPSYAGWACEPSRLYDLERRIRSRSDALRVRVVHGDYRPPAGPGHCHIYVAED